MALVTTPAVVLQTYRYSETSKVVRLATRELGVQSAIAKGALRPKSRFGAGLERCGGGAGDLAALGRGGVRAVARALRPRRHGHRSRRSRPRVLQRGRGRGRLPHLRAGPAAHPAAAAGVPGPPRPERRRSGSAPARRATRGRPPPSRRSLRPTPLRRGGRSLRPPLLGASRIV